MWTLQSRIIMFLNVNLKLIFKGKSDNLVTLIGRSLTSASINHCRRLLYRQPLVQSPEVTLSQIFGRRRCWRRRCRRRRRLRRLQSARWVLIWLVRATMSFFCHLLFCRLSAQPKQTRTVLISGWVHMGFRFCLVALSIRVHYGGKLLHWHLLKYSRNSQ